MADENVLQSFEIEPVKDTYNIVLVSDKAVDVKKTIQSSNKITLSMKDIRVSKTLNTIYNNVSNVDTVMVEPQGNGIKIFFQADNAEAATVTFDALITSVPVNNATKSLKLNNPIESYAPIYNDLLEETSTPSIMNKVKTSSTLRNIKNSIEDEGVSNIANKAISFGLLALLSIAVIRLFMRKEPEIKIGLSQSLTDREINLHKNAMAMQQVTNPYEKSYTSMNYGINAYQKEIKNPYETTSTHFHNPKMKEYANTNSSSYNKESQFTNQTYLNKNVQTKPVVNTQTQVKKMTTPVNNAPVNQSNPNIDNLKFLESMTAIYEKSGRHDLARGLKASLNKNLK